MEAVYHTNEARLHIVTVSIRKESRQVPLDNPRRFGVTIADLTDVFDNLVNGCLRTHAIAVVEGSRVQYAFNPRFQNVAKNMVDDTTSKLRGEYLTPFRY